MKLFGYEINIRKNQQHYGVYIHKNKRNYEAAKLNRLTADWLTSGNLMADEILKWQLPKLRDRSRDLWINDDYAKNFGRKLKVNVIGTQGIGLQSKVRLKNDEFDIDMNKHLESKWAEFSFKNNASICGTQSMKDLCNTAIESCARDGEVLIRKITNADNKFKFTLQVLEADHLDISYNEDLSNGNKIKLGIEKTKAGKPIAYHIFESHPGNNILYQRRLRIPADEIIHIFIQDRPSQSRGVPWAHTALLKLRHLGAYEEAAVINARVGASKMGFIIPPEGGNYEGDDKDSDGNTITEVDSGVIEKLMAGADFKEFTAAYPNGEFPLFTKAMLRGVASGIGCSYNSLANDLEGVNFSSLRSGLLEERDGWKVVQSWFIEHFLDDVFKSWLEMAILSGQVKASILDMERLITPYTPKWQARIWEWVDPLKDIQANVEALKAGLTSRTKICAEQGIDFEDLIEQLAEEEKLMKKYGISFNMDDSKITEKPYDEQEGGDSNASGQSNKTWKTIQNLPSKQAA